MSVEVQIIIAGYTFIVLIIIAILAVPVLVAIITQLIKDLEQYINERKRNERNRRKKM